MQKVKIEISSQKLESVLAEINQLVKEQLVLRDLDCLVWIYESEKHHPEGSFVGKVRIHNPNIIIRLEHNAEILVLPDGKMYHNGVLTEPTELATLISESFPEHLA